MMMRIGMIVLFGVVSFFTPGQNAVAGVIGSDYEIFNPTTDGVDFLTVESAATLKKGQFNLGLMFDFVHSADPQNLPAGTREDESVRNDIGDPSDYMIVGHFSIAVGLMEGWSFGLSFPTVLTQNFDVDTNSNNNLEGLLEVRANTKFRFLGNDRQGLAIIGRVNYNVQEPNPFVGNDPSLIFGADLVANADVMNWLSFAFNAGYQWRSAGDDVAGNYRPLNNMITGSVALAFHLTQNTSFLTEFYGAGTTEETSSVTDRIQSPFEALFGMKHSCGENGSNIHYGVATEMSHGINTADYRVYAGVNWHFGAAKAMAPKYTPPPAPKPMPMPAPMVKAPEQPAQTITVKNIKFASGSAVISKNATTQAELNRVVKALKQRPFTSVEIAGHTDSSGSDALNKKLSQRRSNAIKADLIRRGGFDGSKLKAMGYGESQPISSNATASGRATNRRVEFKIFQ